MSIVASLYFFINLNFLSMKKFYSVILASVCVVGMSANLMAGTENPNSPKKQLKPLNSVVKKDSSTLKNLNASAMQKADLSKLGEVKVNGMMKADSNNSIEGIWRVQFGDYYFDESIGGPVYVNYEATLDGDKLKFVDPTGYEADMYATFNENDQTVTFETEYIGAGYLSIGIGYLFQKPFEWTNTIELTTSLVGTYDPFGGRIDFPFDQGIAWIWYADMSATTPLGYNGIYDLEGAVKQVPEEDIDEVQEGQWRSVGTATFVDAWILPSYSMDGVNRINPNLYPVEVELQQNIENENLYRLWRPFKSTGYPALGLNQSLYNGQIQLDVSDPDHVFVVPCGLPSGFKNSNGEFYVSNELGWYINDGYDKDVVISVLYGNEPYDTFKEGVITINDPIFDFSKYYAEGYTWNNNPYQVIITFNIEDNVDESILGEWYVARDWHYAGDDSRGLKEEKFTASLDGNKVIFENGLDEKFIAHFTGENTLTFKVAAHSEDDMGFLTQAPFTDGTKVTHAGIDAENFVFGEFEAVYDAEAGVITFPEGCGLALGYANSDGEFSSYHDGYDFVSAARTKQIEEEDSVNTIGEDNNSETIYFDLTGRRVMNPQEGIFIKKTGSKVEKAVIK